MRKIITILFLLVIFTSHIGYYIVYAFQQHQIWEEVKRQLVLNIPDSSFQLIIAEQNDSFRWEEEGKEFYQDGQLYDVAKSVKKDGKTILYCINDKIEEDFLFHFGKTSKSENNKGGTLTHKVQVIDFLDELIKSTAVTHPVLNQKYHPFNSVIITFCKEVNAPPPRI